MTKRARRLGGRLAYAGVAAASVAIAVPLVGGTTVNAVRTAAGGNGNGNQGVGNGNGGNGVTFALTGIAPTDLRPGTSRPVDIRIKNPWTFGIKITKIEVASPLTLVPAVAGCPVTGNFSATNYTGAPLSIARGRTLQLSTTPGLSESSWPQIAMASTATNQDRCQGASYTLSYTATAVQDK